VEIFQTKITSTTKSDNLMNQQSKSLIDGNLVIFLMSTNLPLLVLVIFVIGGGAILIIEKSKSAKKGYCSFKTPLKKSRYDQKHSIISIVPNSLF